MTDQNEGAYIPEAQVEDLARRISNRVVSLLATHFERTAEDPPAAGKDDLGPNGEGNPNVDPSDHEQTK